MSGPPDRDGIAFDLLNNDDSLGDASPVCRPLLLLPRLVRRSPIVPAYRLAVEKALLPARYPGRHVHVQRRVLFIIILLLLLTVLLLRLYGGSIEAQTGLIGRRRHRKQVCTAKHRGEEDSLLLGGKLHADIHFNCVCSIDTEMERVLFCMSKHRMASASLALADPGTRVAMRARAPVPYPITSSTMVRTLPCPDRSHWHARSAGQALIEIPCHC